MTQALLEPEEITDAVGFMSFGTDPFFPSSMEKEGINTEPFRTIDWHSNLPRHRRRNLPKPRCQ